MLSIPGWKAGMTQVTSVEQLMTTDRIGIVVGLCTCVQEVLGSNLARDTDYHGIFLFTSILLGKFRNITSIRPPYSLGTDSIVK
jgi:hypothetical protein